MFGSVLPVPGLGGFWDVADLPKYFLTLQGGTITFTQGHLEAVNNATVKFSQTATDPKAAILPTYNYILGMVSFFCLCTRALVYAWGRLMILMSLLSRPRSPL